MTTYYKATARGVTVTRSTERRTYTHAVVVQYAARQSARDPAMTFPAWIDSAWSSSRVLAHQNVGRFSRAAWAEIAPAVQIDAQEYRALRQSAR